MFHLLANNVSSRDYYLEVINTPRLLSFDMLLDYPAYTKKQDEILKSNGNAIVPQGTKVTWNLKTKSTDKVILNTPDSLVSFSGENEEFQLSQRLYKSLDYSLQTSNKNLKNYESLAFQLM